MFLFAAMAAISVWRLTIFPLDRAWPTFLAWALRTRKSPIVILGWDLWSTLLQVIGLSRWF